MIRVAAPLAALAALSLSLAACSKSTECPSGETSCGGACVSLLTDADNCGACGVKASALQACRAGVLTCAAGVATCDGACTDLARDAANCGACGATCGEGELCSTAGDGTCVEAAACTGAYSACGGACVELESDRMNCGACGNACADGQTCRSGACTADLVVACGSSSDLRPLTADLLPAGAARSTGGYGSPAALAMDGAAVYSANGYPLAALSVFPLDDQQATRSFTLSGTDLEGIALYAGTVLVSNDYTHNLEILDPGKGVLDELPMPGTSPYPHGIGVVGTTAYVALYGSAYTPGVGGQQIAKVDLSALPACVAGTADSCGAVASEAIDLTAVAGAADPGSYPYPSAVAVRGTKVYVTLANLALGCGGYSAYCLPSGSGRLAVIDTAAGDAVSIVDLGSGCRNPGDIEISGGTAWVACGSYSYPDMAPGAVVALDLTGAAPTVAMQVDASKVAAGKIAICGGYGYVTDQLSGKVLRFDLATGQPDAPVDVCPAVDMGGYSYALASDVVCPAD